MLSCYDILLSIGAVLLSSSIVLMYSLFIADPLTNSLFSLCVKQPWWEEAASILPWKANVQLVSLNCAMYSRICRTFKIQAYPTLKYVRGPEDANTFYSALVPTDDEKKHWVYEYKGDRSTAGLSNFIGDPSEWEKVPRMDLAALRDGERGTVTETKRGSPLWTAAGLLVATYACWAYYTSKSNKTSKARALPNKALDKLSKTK
jgi:hypothetical protein